MMQLLNTDGAWIAIGVTVFSIVVGLVMKRVFVNILKNNPSESTLPCATSETSKHD